jgi:hypothetical protein
MGMSAHDQATLQESRIFNSCLNSRNLASSKGFVKMLASEGFCSIENKFFPMSMNKNKPRSDLRDAKQRAGKIRSTYPCRSHSGNIQMNVAGVVVLASPPRDPIQVPQRVVSPSDAHVQRNDDSSSSVQQGVVEW